MYFAEHDFPVMELLGGIQTWKECRLLVEPSIERRLEPIWLSRRIERRIERANEVEKPQGGRAAVEREWLRSVQ
jgi:hypothetical protein